MKIFLWSFLSFFLFLGGLIFFLEEKHFFQISKEGIVFSPSSEEDLFFEEPLGSLKKKIQDQVIGKSLLKIDIRSISSLIQKEPWIRSFSILRRWPGEIRIEWALKKVVAFYLPPSGGSLGPILDEGSLLPPFKKQRVVDLPLLVGDKFKSNQDLRSRALKFFKEIPLEGEFSQKKIAEIRYQEKEGFSLILVQSGLLIKMGEDVEIKLKSARIAKVLEYIKDHGIQAKWVDADLSKKVRVKRALSP